MERILPNRINYPSELKQIQLFDLTSGDLKGKILRSTFPIASKFSFPQAMNYQTITDANMHLHNAFFAGTQVTQSL